MQKPDRIFRIFISSTQKDLMEERKAIVEQVLRAGHIPSGMEMFSAGNTEDLKVIKAAIDRCDIYVVVVGSRFGSTKRDEDGNIKSFTQIEFDYASRVRKPILGFLMNEDEFKKRREALKAEAEDETNEEASQRAKEELKFTENLKALRESISSDRIVGHFGESPGGTGVLQAKFHAALDKLIEADGFAAPGLTVYDPESVSLGTISNNPFLRDIIDKLKGYSVLAERCTKHGEMKRGMANYFRHQYLARVIDSGYRNLFFESGSTIAFLSAMFSKWLLNPTGLKYFDEWHISTNNILTYLQFVLTRNIKVELFPYGPPEKKYGATFGDIEKLPKYPAPGPPRMPESAKATVAEIAAGLKSSEKTLILATASGLDLDKETPMGPHVGDYYNKLFKRAIFSTRCPVVLFLDGSKLSEQYNSLHCFPVCDSELSWASLCASTPLALCIGTESRERRLQVIEQIAPYGFTQVESLDPTNLEKKYEGCWPLLASNQLFDECLKLPD